MALITLPNSEVWDTELPQEEQTEAAQTWFQETIDAGDTAELCEVEYCGDDLNSVAVNRCTKKVYEDIAAGVKIDYDRTYVHPCGDRRCGAVKAHTYTVIEII